MYVAVALAWLTATLLVPAHDRPYAIGSTNGSAWNAAFVFNGTDRLGGKSPEPQQTVYEPGHHYPVATQSERDHIPIVPPSPTRLLARIGPLSGERLGLELLVALLLGVPALLSAREPERRRGRAPRVAGAGRGSPPTAAPGCAGRWPSGYRCGCSPGIVLFSHMARLHPRYVEGFTPAVAAMLGIGVAWAASSKGRARLVLLAGTLLIAIVYAERLLYGRPGVWWIALAGALGAVAFAGLARLATISAALRSALAPVGVLAMTSIAVLAIPLSADVTAIKDHVTDAGYVGALPSEEQRLLSAYLRAHQGGARYEVAAESATQIGSLIVQDARPIVVLTSYGARVFTSVAKLERLIAPGQVRYAFLNTSCGRHASALNAACSAPARWVRAHGTDVSRQAGLSRDKLLWLLPGAWRERERRAAPLQALAAGARAAGKIALDTEFMGEGRYRTLLCLVQLAIPDGAARAPAERIEIVDPLAEDLDGAPLAAVLADPAIQVVVHAGRQDVALVRRRFGTDVKNVFDTQVAAGFVGMGAQSSYESLLAEMLGVRVAKSASFTRWDARPLSPEQLAYAREDVVHLLELAAELERRLTALGRLEWAREECEPLERSSDERDPETIFARLPRVRGLSASARPIARELVEWREQTAARQDRPAQSVLSDAALVEIAKRKPSVEPRAGADPRHECGQPATEGPGAAGGGGTRTRASTRAFAARSPPADDRARGRAARIPGGGAPSRARPRGRSRLRAARRARRPAGDRRGPARGRRGGRRAHPARLAARAGGRGAARAARRPRCRCRGARRAAGGRSPRDPLPLRRALEPI